MSDALPETPITIVPVPPYDFDLTAAYATYFRGRYGTDSFENGVFRRLLDVDGVLFLSGVTSTGSTSSPRLSLILKGNSLNSFVAEKAVAQIERILGTGQDVNPFYEMATHFPVLTRLTNVLNGLHVPQTGSVFEALILAVLGQQISAQVAFKLRNALIETYGPRLTIDGVTYRAFPSPDLISSTSLEALRVIGLSARKAEYVLDVSRRITSGEIDLEALRNRSDEEIIATLTDIRGVGDWTAQWLLIRAFGRSDGFPASDLALLRMMGILHGKSNPVSPKEAIEFSKRWSPFRSYVTTYLFAAARSGHPELIAPADSPD